MQDWNINDYFKESRSKMIFVVALAVLALATYKIFSIQRKPDIGRYTLGYVAVTGIGSLPVVLDSQSNRMWIWSTDTKVMQEVTFRNFN